jgi:DNA-binding NtrC family response regulator
LVDIIKVFIVEDDLDIAHLYQKLLVISGYDVVGIAENGETAINMYQSFSEKPDIIVMDHRMPIKNGIDATTEILKIEKTQKVIFASADRSVKKEIFSIGAVNFLEKPFSLDSLTQCIKRTLNSKTVEDEQISEKYFQETI